MTTQDNLDIEYYDDSADTGNFYVCINWRHLFVARPDDENPQWEWLNPHYGSWNSAHQRIYRNPKWIEKITKEQLPAVLLPAPDSIPAVALDPPRPPPPPPLLQADYPVVTKVLAECEGHSVSVWVVLFEDLYESLHGDGEFHDMKAVFLTQKDAETLKEALDSENYLHHIRSGRIWLEGNEICCKVAWKIFDEGSGGEVLKMLTSALLPGADGAAEPV